MILTYRYRLLPSSAQHDRLRQALEHSREIYNAALQERIECYRLTGKTRTNFDQCKGLTELRKDADFTRFPVTLQRWPLKKIDLAFKAFFRRVKVGEKPGFPRFKGRDWFKSFGFTDKGGWKVEGRGLRMKGIGRIRMHLHRALPSNPKALTIRRAGRHWYACIAVEVECADPANRPPVGLDMGVAHLATTSDGEHVANPRVSRRSERAVRLAQRKLARARRGSRNRRKAKERLAALKAKDRRRRATYAHQVSARIAKAHSIVAVEKLAITNMTRSAKGTAEEPGRNVKAKAGLNREMQDAAWGRLKELLTYKCALHGGQLVEVDPRNTSQHCSGCGVVVPKKLRDRWHDCPDCGLSIDRDHNAALNVLRRAVVGPDDLNLEAA